MVLALRMLLRLEAILPLTNYIHNVCVKNLNIRFLFKAIVINQRRQQ